ncbi:ROK family transcriptional regulator [Schaalia sp. 19OD2882]|uniref:ROK family transcriptional regulator n=1 Tax=Schaalia sp. 19OD2882 TaxID=2794089 RepID=UPI001C1F1126|nr:ROK family transcriptional regulator [Schaalia sp. 19OD2882]QWW20512.1 ROK family transcriptional regulator [Schaalia sp. 19OD2882]
MSVTEGPTPEGVHREILALVTSGQARTRADLSRALHLAPSTVSLRVSELLARGHLEETGNADSTGGRRARLLDTCATSSFFLAAELGSTHARCALADASGALVEVRTHEVGVQDGPQSTLETLVGHFRDLADAHGATEHVEALCVALPAPIDPRTGLVDSASRMPGWNGFPVGQWLQEHLGVPARVENDADMVALGEHHAHPELRHSLTVKAGTGLGVGMVVDGLLHRGSTGAAGDISHVRRPTGPHLVCACGNTGCLATVASGEALLRRWIDEGGAGADLGAMTEAAANGDPSATNILREAGEVLGDVLCAVTSFLNPDAVLLGGLLSSVDVYVASVRASLYRGCHPLVTRDLVIERAVSGADAGVLGAVRVARSLHDLRPV